MTQRLGVALLFCLSWHQAALAQPKAGIDSLAWLAGCWSLEVKGRSGSEQWMKPEGQTMLGMSRTVVSGKTVAYEFMQIRQNEAGGVEYVAQPSGQAETVFKSTKLDATEAVFENPGHDFPQKVIYRRTGEDSLLARIEGESKGSQKGIDFPMRRAKCP